jgi:hypothetical protein
MSESISKNYNKGRKLGLEDLWQFRLDQRSVYCERTKKLMPAAFLCGMPFSVVVSWVRDGVYEAVDKETPLGAQYISGITV